MSKTSNKISITEEWAEQAGLPDGRTELIVWDAKQPGLALRIGRTRKSWVIVYRPSGAGRSRNPQKVTLGAYPSVSVSDARKAARARLGEVAGGRDPAAERREAKRRERATVSAAINDHEASLKSRGVVKISDIMTTLRRGLAGHLSKDLADLDLRDFLTPVERLEAAGKPGAASYARARFRAFLGWAHVTGRIKANPMAGVRRDRSTRSQRLATAAKGRALSADELRAVWGAAYAETSFGRLVRALILSGSRRVEMARLEPGMIGADRLTIPPTHTKQGREHIIPISRQFRAVLDACPSSSSALVFPSTRTGREIKGWTKLVGQLQEGSGVQFTLHDLRRTMRSGLTTLGVPADLAEVCIGHQRDELLEIYDHADRWPERAAAFQRWADHVEEITRGTNPND